jgi:hypothetical protein
MDLKGLTDKAKELVQKRGGTDSLKEDAEELKRIAEGPGSASDKTKAAASAIKEPGADEAEASAADPATDPERARAAEKIEGEGRGKHKHADESGGRGGRKGRGRRRRGGRRDPGAV